MDRHATWTTLRHVLIGATIGSAAAILLVIESVRREATREAAKAPMWPRPDTGVESFGEVWDIPSDQIRANVGPALVAPTRGG